LKRRHQDYYGIWLDRAHTAGDGEPVNIREVIVQQYNIKPGVLDLSDGFVACKDRTDFESPFR